MTPENLKRFEEVQLLTAFLNLKLTNIDFPELDLERGTTGTEPGCIANLFESPKNGIRGASIKLTSNISELQATLLRRQEEKKH